jgi:hypothetical protein
MRPGESRRSDDWAGARPRDRSSGGGSAARRGEGGDSMPGPARKPAGGRRFPWVWVIGLPALAIVAWVGIELFPSRASAPAVVSGNAGGGRGTMPSPELTNFVEFARQAHVPPRSTDAAYIHRGMNRLSAALQDLAEQGPRNPVVENHLAELRRLLPGIGSGAGGADQQVRSVREAFLLATGTMDAIATERTPGARPLIQFVRDAAQSITPDRSLASQMEKVQDFFQQAGYAVIALAPSSSAVAEAGG